MAVVWIRAMTGRPVDVPCLRQDADDGLPEAARGRVEGTDGIVEARDVTDVGPQPSCPRHPLHHLTEFGAIGFDDELVARPSAGLGFDRLMMTPQCSSGLDQGGGLLLDVATDDIEDQVERGRRP